MQAFANVVDLDCALAASERLMSERLSVRHAEVEGLHLSEHLFLPPLLVEDVLLVGHLGVRLDQALIEVLPLCFLVLELLGLLLHLRQLSFLARHAHSIFVLFYRREPALASHAPNGLLHALRLPDFFRAHALLRVARDLQHSFGWFRELIHLQ